MTSARSGTTSSAAADGVGARTSAAKSASVTSTSCPTPHTTGIGCATTARTTRSSLNDHRSSSEPPPRARIVTDGASSARPAAARSPDPALEPPQRGHDARRRARRPAPGRDEDDAGQRPAPREHVAHVAPDGAGRRRDDGDDARPVGQRPLARGVEQALRGERAPSSCSNRSARSPKPDGWSDSTYSWSAPCGSNTSMRPCATTWSPVCGWNGDRHAVVAEPDALELGAGVLEREVRVARASRR